MSGPTFAHPVVGASGKHTPSHFADHRRHVYDTTRWERMLWDLRADAPAVRGAVDGIADSVRVQRNAEDAALGNGARIGRETTPRDDANDVLGEVFARLYNDPSRLADEDRSGSVPWAGPAHEVLDALPEWSTLREQCAGDPDIAALAAAEMAKAIAAKLPELMKQAEQDERDAAAKEAGGTAEAPSAQALAAASACRAEMRRAIGVAEQRVGEAREALSGLAPGLEAAPPTHQQTDPRRLNLADSLSRNPRLREVLRKAGRITRLARDTRSVRDPHARSEVLDLERGADLARVLPAELAGLRSPRLRSLTLAKLVERRALQYRLGGKERLGRGPIVVMLDRSGSMSGEPEMWASACAIAMVGAGARERRPITIVEFTATPDNVTRVDRGRGVRIAPDGKQTDVGDVAGVALDLAGRRSTGGTRFGPVLDAALKLGALDDRADLVIVTDGQAETVSMDALAKLEEAKTRGVRLFGLVVNNGSMTPAIAQLCDVAIDLDKEQDVAAAIARAMPDNR